MPVEVSNEDLRPLIDIVGVAYGSSNGNRRPTHPAVKCSCVASAIEKARRVIEAQLTPAWRHHKRRNMAPFMHVED